jgi:tetratricopeptide (TPR) repeat protein
MTKVKCLLLVAVVLLFSGCAKEQLLIDVYSAPKELKQVEGMISSNTKLGSYLIISINPDVEMTQNVANAKILENYLVSNIEQMLTQTGFFTLHPIYSESDIKLDMKVIEYRFEEGSNSVNADLSVDFVVMKNASKYFNKVYHQKVKLQSRAGRSALPTNSSILADLAKQITQKFAKDISPMRTKKLVELKPLPKTIAYTIAYAKAGNYESAIEAMKKYEGSKEVNYYFNLAVYYEGLAAKTQSLELLEKASENYEQAMRLSGAKDEQVIKEKAKFDNFYHLFLLIDNQRQKNEDKIKAIDKEFSISR